MRYKIRAGKTLSLVLISGMLLSISAVQAEAAVITSNATDKVAVVFNEHTAYRAGDPVIQDGEMYICTDDVQGAWQDVSAAFMQITKNQELGTKDDLSASYEESRDPSEETSLMAFAANVWQKMKGFFGIGSKEEEVSAGQYKNASVSAKLNYLQQQNQQLGQNVTDLQGWISQSFTSVSNGKSTLAATITDKGVTVGAQASFPQIDQAIRDLTSLQYSNGYEAGIAFADSRVNENSASYQQGTSVFQPQIWETEIRIDKEGADKERECFTKHEGITSNHVEYSFRKEFRDHTIIAVYMDEYYSSAFGSSGSKELVTLMGNRYEHLSTTRGNALGVSKESISWGNVSFNILDTGTYDMLKLKVVYI